MAGRQTLSGSASGDALLKIRVAALLRRRRAKKNQHVSANFPSFCALMNER
jgi:hypothetical protein